MHEAELKVTSLRLVIDPEIGQIAFVANIIVIDDDPDIRELIKSALESAGHKVSVAPDGREGIRQCRAAQFDLVITDLFMPEQEGLETIKQLRMQAPDVRIVAISGKPTGGTMLEVAKRLGADAVLPKPFMSDELLEIVEQTL
jgi:DNA-binding response OmpR family regulator